MFAPNSKKPRLSLVLLSYAKTPDLQRLTRRALVSYKGQSDEVILTEDGGEEFDWPPEVDTFIWHANQGFTKNANLGWRQARGEYVAIVSNDTQLLAGNLRELCIKDTVTSPRVENQALNDSFAGCFFVVPRTVFEKVGLLDESMHTYYSDTEYIDRLRKAGVSMKIVHSVTISHDQAQTVTEVGQNTPEQSGKDREAYRKKVI